VIPTIYWACYKSQVIKGTICRYIQRNKYNVLPTTLPRISWHTWQNGICIVYDLFINIIFEQNTTGMNHLTIKNLFHAY
jgi:hypothetical protein